MNLIFRLTISTFYLFCGTTVVSPKLHSHSEEHKNVCLHLNSVCMYALTNAEESAPTCTWWFGSVTPIWLCALRSLITFEHFSPKQLRTQSWEGCSYSTFEGGHRQITVHRTGKGQSFITARAAVDAKTTDRLFRTTVQEKSRKRHLNKDTNSLHKLFSNSLWLNLVRSFSLEPLMLAAN